MGRFLFDKNKLGEVKFNDVDDVIIKRKTKGITLNLSEY